ncbi:uncharacterized protein LOC124441038 [Xenia sp. Carnegie-2017]|uniref:uncharacterized protein LOC124441038 n=1 Tax=Xenia sp. Carnegie-2017 TaxID=2897299 RepID=UPI001F04842B|nr:uncharacterized protein LOC124441038 [Xenia sp. Carnegie-2017]
MEIDISFPESLEKVTFASLLIESVKYLMFHRYQTPLPIDQLQAEDERDRRHENARRSPRHRPIPAVLKKKRKFLAEVDDLLINLYQVFLQTDVVEMILLFGATLVSPKEIYSIKFEGNHELTSMDEVKIACATGKENHSRTRSKFQDKCCRKLAKCLFTNPSLNKLGELGTTSMHCLILAPRTTETSWLRPRASFKLPCKIKPYKIKIQGAKDDSKMVSKDVMESKDVDGHVGMLVENDLLWFETPVVIKGYKGAFT